MSDKTVSIIVPFYNTDILYCKKCLSSLCNQSYGNIEIIVVDDGSTRESAILLDEVSLCDSRIRVIHKPNGGVSSARNIGINAAKGEYIAFVDSDDWVEPSFIEILVGTLEDNSVQISVVGVFEEYSDKETIIDNRCVQTLLFSKQEMYAALLTNSTNIHGYLCNKLFKKDLITQLLNEEYHYCEDLVFNAHYMRNIKRGAVSTARLYHYRLGQGNATGNFNYNLKILTLIEAYREVERIFSVECPVKNTFIRHAILKQALNIRARYKICNIDNIDQYQYLQTIIAEYWDAYKAASFSEKVNIRLTQALPVILFKIKRFILNLKH